MHDVPAGDRLLLGTGWLTAGAGREILRVIASPRLPCVALIQPRSGCTSCGAFVTNSRRFVEPLRGSRSCTIVTQGATAQTLG